MTLVDFSDSEYLSQQYLDKDEKYIVHLLLWNDKPAKIVFDGVAGFCVFTNTGFPMGLRGKYHRPPNDGGVFFWQVSLAIVRWFWCILLFECLLWKMVLCRSQVLLLFGLSSSQTIKINRTFCQLNFCSYQAMSHCTR
jgi:hypothetical protein